MPAWFDAFLRLSRLKFLLGGVAGGLLGTAIAAYESGRIDWLAYATAQVTITAFHLMVHYANDYFDRSGDALASRTPFSGGSGALVDGTLAPAVALRAALASACVGCLGAVALAAWQARPLAALLALGIGLLAWAYSAPPLRLLARGLGEGDTALVVAVLVPLCAFTAQRGVPDLRALASTLPGAAAMFAMMLAVEFPDRAADAASGKRNIVVRLGARGVRPVALVATLCVYVAVCIAVIAGAPPAYALLEALSLPLAAAYLRELRDAGEPGAACRESLAACGVVFFFIVTAYGVLAYAAAPHAGTGIAQLLKRSG